MTQGAAQRRPPLRDAFLAALRDALEQAVRENRPAADDIVFVSTGAPGVSLKTFASHRELDVSVVWAPPAGTRCIGLGVLETVQHEPSSTLHRTKEAIRGVLGRVLLAETQRRPSPAPLTSPESAASAPRMFGGLAFRPDAAPPPEWRAFGAGMFVLPEVTYSVHEGRAVVSVATRRDRLEGSLLLLEQLADALFAPNTKSSPGAIVAAKTHHPSRAQYVTAVDSVRRAILDDDVQKVVLARRSTIELHKTEGREAARSALVALYERFPKCIHFAMSRGNVTFLGATPEYLVTRSADRVHTEALAGSMPVGEAEALRKSVKDREEHRFVVDAIVHALAPYCVSVTHDPSPGVRELPNVIHLRTPIEGRLRGDVHVLDLVGALHPTPAVGGVPKQTALEHIQRHEVHGRGWYSAPFGWVDALGNGRFVVALRSGLVDEDEGVAHVYAGAGIVRDSIADAEFDETELKMRPILGALGALGALDSLGDPGRGLDGAEG